MKYEYDNGNGQSKYSEKTPRNAGIESAPRSYRWRVGEDPKNGINIPFFWSSPTRDMASSFLRFLDHTQRRTTVESSGRMISSSQRPLPDNTQRSQRTNINAPRWDSNPQSKQEKGCRPTPWTSRPLGPAYNYTTL